MNNIIEYLDELIVVIKNTSEYRNYLHILKQVEENKDIKKLVNNIKRLQKKAVKEESLNHKVNDLDNILNDKIKELNSIPLYSDYINACNEVNDIIKITKDKFQNYFDNLM